MSHIEVGLSYVQKKNSLDEEVSLVGTMNEACELVFDRLLGSLGENVAFNLRAVRAINSSGVRAWINFIREVSRSRNVVLEECSPEIISQINMVPSFLGKAKLSSFYAAYTCERCGAEHEQRYELKSLIADHSLAAKSKTCNSCAGTMVMDDDFFWSFMDDGAEQRLKS